MLTLAPNASTVLTQKMLTSTFYQRTSEFPLRPKLDSGLIMFDCVTGDGWDVDNAWEQDSAEASKLPEKRSDSLLSVACWLVVFSYPVIITWIQPPRLEAGSYFFF